MNIFELFYVFFVITAGYCLGKSLSILLGNVGWVLGFPVGSILAIVILKVVGFLIDPWKKSNPNLPKCKNKKCHGDRYELTRATDEGTIYCCSCGIKYVFTGSQFKELLDDGTTKPYMKRTKTGPWENDKLAELKS